MQIIMSIIGFSYFCKKYILDMKTVESLKLLNVRSSLKKNLFTVEQRVDKTGKILYLVEFNDGYICFQSFASVIDFLSTNF